ncbi:hypothetical protein EAE32_05560 [Kocuria tytonicola]|uniref:Uncharacterized protein n=1 Tax=Kocuria tytonicola TaxID=2055946 RepID=A0A3L9L6K7_9MICC|nr:hypothetical protein [Kocuria tytonicola]RLY94626.1 hypothetical protein EAE32_05560 [Kocuria tytonicola]
MTRNPAVTDTRTIPGHSTRAGASVPAAASLVLARTGPGRFAVARALPGRGAGSVLAWPGGPELLVR